MTLFSGLAVDSFPASDVNVYLGKLTDKMSEYRVRISILRCKRLNSIVVSKISHLEYKISILEDLHRSLSMGIDVRKNMISAKLLLGESLRVENLN